MPKLIHVIQTSQLSQTSHTNSLPDDICLVSLIFFLSCKNLIKYFRPGPMGLLGLQYLFRFLQLLKKFKSTRQYRPIVNSAKASFTIARTSLYFGFTASAVQPKYRPVLGVRSQYCSVVDNARYVLHRIQARERSSGGDVYYICSV